MSSLTDVVSIFKNLVTTVSVLNVQRQTSTTVTSATLVVAGQGTLISYCVTVTGSAAGTVNNAPTTGQTGASNVLVPVPNTLGAVQVGLAFNRGLVIVPGTGQSLNVTYSMGSSNAAITGP